MVRSSLLATFALALVALSSPAEARPRPNGHINGRSFEANKTFGLGLELGAPTGINGKYFVASDRALDFGLGWIYTYAHRNGGHIYADYLFHPASLVQSEALELPFYIGFGGRLWDFEGRDNDDALAVGFRVPIGLSFDFNNVPVDIFVQLVPTLDFFSGYREHDVYLDIDFSLGIRYWFN